MSEGDEPQFETMPVFPGRVSPIFQCSHCGNKVPSGIVVSEGSSGSIRIGSVKCQACGKWFSPDYMRIQGTSVYRVAREVIRGIYATNNPLGFAESAIRTLKMLGPAPTTPQIESLAAEPGMAWLADVVGVSENAERNRSLINLIIQVLLVIIAIRSGNADDAELKRAINELETKSQATTLVQPADAPFRNYMVTGVVNSTRFQQSIKIEARTPAEALAKAKDMDMTVYLVSEWR